MLLLLAKQDAQAAAGLALPLALELSLFLGLGLAGRLLAPDVFLASPGADAFVSRLPRLGLAWFASQVCE